MSTTNPRERWETLNAHLRIGEGGTSRRPRSPDVHWHNDEELRQTLRAARALMRPVAVSIIRKRTGVVDQFDLTGIRIRIGKRHFGAWTKRQSNKWLLAIALIPFLRPLSVVEDPSEAF